MAGIGKKKRYPGWKNLPMCVRDLRKKIRPSGCVLSKREEGGIERLSVEVLDGEPPLESLIARQENGSSSERDFTLDTFGFQKTLFHPRMEPGSERPVLLVEDDENDVFFLRFAWEEGGISNPLIACPDGADAIDYFSATGRYQNRSAYPLPCLVLTDLKMPRVDGFGLQKWLQAHSEFANIPRIALSSSNEDSDRERVLSLGASQYLLKPLTVAERGDLVRLLATRWLGKTPPAHQAKQPRQSVELRR
jgi:CheY-like chemotaxis protein